ncbi:MAG: Response regulator of the LytR/AlgR family [Herbinix sp.]|jgi:two-component system LytT family response regulator|nr:Response regulator of the LytR/AlgR family [Herbinix sp.]
MIYKIGICDDEKLQVKVNALYVKDIFGRKDLEVDIKAFISSEQLEAYLAHNPLDILLLDIDMAGKSGIRVAQRLLKAKLKTEIIFVTGHNEFANEAFDVGAMGYIRKPVDSVKLENALSKAIIQVTYREDKTEVIPLVVTIDNLKKKLNTDEIRYIERLQAKSVIYIGNKEYGVYETISSLMERLNESFIRINQSIIVNKNIIKDIQGNTVFLEHGMEVAIGRTFKKDVMNGYYDK